MKKYWLVIIAIIIIIVVILALVFRNGREVTTGFQFYLAPDNVSVTIDDGEPFTITDYGSKVEWQPGDYTLELSFDGFESQTIESTVNENELTEVFASLTPITDEAQAMMSTEEMQLRGELVGGMENRAGGAQLEEQYPFIAKLPIYAQFYTIAPCQDGDEMVICATMFLDNDVQRANALTDISEAGIDENVRVIYRDS
jgi:hypothetical protein